MAAGVTQPIHANGHDDGAGSKTEEKKRSGFSYRER